MAKGIAVYWPKCNGCGECVKVCSETALEVVDGIAHPNVILCICCEACEEVCPTNAIGVNCT